MATEDTSASGSGVFRAVQRALFACRIVTVDSYMAPPLLKEGGLALPVQGPDGAAASTPAGPQVQHPVVRVFGATPAGQKTCVHVHGAFPYFYVGLPNVRELVTAGTLSQVLQGLEADLDRSLAGSSRPEGDEQGAGDRKKDGAAADAAAGGVSAGLASPASASSAPPRLKAVRSLLLVSGIPFYGFHAGGPGADPSTGSIQGEGHAFIKVVLFNPALTPRAVAFFEGRGYQPYEAHIPFLLQFFIDYNLFGMALLCASDVRFRSPLPVSVPQPPLPPTTLRVRCWRPHGGTRSSSNDSNDNPGNGGPRLGLAYDGSASVDGGVSLMTRVWMTSNTPSGLMWPVPTREAEQQQQPVHAPLAAAPPPLVVPPPAAPRAPPSPFNEEELEALAAAMSQDSDATVLLAEGEEQAGPAAAPVSVLLPSSLVIAPELRALVPLQPAAAQPQAQAPAPQAAPPPAPAARQQPAAPGAGAPLSPPVPGFAVCQRYGIARPRDRHGYPSAYTMAKALGWAQPGRQGGPGGGWSPAARLDCVSEAQAVLSGTLRVTRWTVSKGTTCEVEADVWVQDLLNPAERDALQSAPEGDAALPCRSVLSLLFLWDEELRRRTGGAGGGSTAAPAAAAAAMPTPLELSATQSRPAAGAGTQTSGAGVPTQASAGGSVGGSGGASDVSLSLRPDEGYERKLARLARRDAAMSEAQAKEGLPPAQTPLAAFIASLPRAGVPGQYGQEPFPLRPFLHLAASAGGAGGAGGGAGSTAAAAAPVHGPPPPRPPSSSAPALVASATSRGDSVAPISLSTQDDDALLAVLGQLQGSDDEEAEAEEDDGAAAAGRKSRRGSAFSSSSESGGSDAEAEEDGKDAEAAAAQHAPSSPGVFGTSLQPFAQSSQKSQLQRGASVRFAQLPPRTDGMEDHEGERGNSAASEVQALGSVALGRGGGRDEDGDATQVLPHGAPLQQASLPRRSPSLAAGLTTLPSSRVHREWSDILTQSEALAEPLTEASFSGTGAAALSRGGSMALRLGASSPSRRASPGDATTDGTGEVPASSSADATPERTGPSPGRLVRRLSRSIIKAVNDLGASQAAGVASQRSLDMTGSVMQGWSPVLSPGSEHGGRQLAGLKRQRGADGSQGTDAPGSPSARFEDDAYESEDEELGSAAPTQPVDETLLDQSGATQGELAQQQQSRPDHGSGGGDDGGEGALPPKRPRLTPGVLSGPSFPVASASPADVTLILATQGTGVAASGARLAAASSLSPAEVSARLHFGMWDTQLPQPAPGAAVIDTSPVAVAAPSNPHPVLGGGCRLYRMRAAAPSLQQLQSTWHLFDLPAVAHPAVHYSKDEDIPPQPVSFAGLEFRVPGSSLRHLQPFDTGPSVAAAASAAAATAAAAARSSSFALDRSSLTRSYGRDPVARTLQLSATQASSPGPPAPGATTALLRLPRLRDIRAAVQAGVPWFHAEPAVAPARRGSSAAALVHDSSVIDVLSPAEAGSSQLPIYLEETQASNASPSHYVEEGGQGPGVGTLLPELIPAPGGMGDAGFIRLRTYVAGQPTASELPAPALATCTAAGHIVQLPGGAQHLTCCRRTLMWAVPPPTYAATQAWLAAHPPPAPPAAAPGAQPGTGVGAKSKAKGSKSSVANGKGAGPQFTFDATTGALIPLKAAPPPPPSAVSPAAAAVASQASVTSTATGANGTAVSDADVVAMNNNEHLTLCCLEVHAQTRGPLVPDPRHDPLLVVSYIIADDMLGASRVRSGAYGPPATQADILTPKLVRGCIVVDDTLPPGPPAGLVAEADYGGGSMAAGTRGRYPFDSYLDPRGPLYRVPVPGARVQAQRAQPPAPVAARLGLPPDVVVTRVPTELDLLWATVALVCDWDADVLLGYEIQRGSLGYLLERGKVHGLDLAALLSRTPAAGPDRRQGQDAYGEDHDSGIWVSGRMVLNVWRIMRSELKLGIYTLENVVANVLQKRLPHFPPPVLTAWWNGPPQPTRAASSSSAPPAAWPVTRGRVPDYLLSRAYHTLAVLDAVDVMGRSSEMARLFGIDFFSVLSRGSQYRVEAVMLRVSKPSGYLAPSPSRAQVANQAPMKVVPLIMEPQSRVFTSPVVVLDFQSLYPSMIIGYNLCYSTLLGRVLPDTTRDEWAPKIGFLQYHPPAGALARTYVTPGEGTAIRRCEAPPWRTLAPAERPPRPQSAYLDPNGVTFVQWTARRGVLPRMLQEILDTRVMVKATMKRAEVKSDPVLSRLLHARQFALKMIANVTYGYTAAGYSGRMPCAEIADAIVQTARTTLERAVALVHEHPSWRAEVVYGDTDSLFVHLPGRSVEEAFRIGGEIAEQVTLRNPRPVTLKLEKVYRPCVLVAKKRYAGFMYESAGQAAPTLECKGLELVRRDTCGVVARLMDAALRTLFTSMDLSAVRAVLTQAWAEMLAGRTPVQEFIFAKEVRLGTYADRGPLPPAAVVASKRMLLDPRTQPLYAERIPYLVVYGQPGARLTDLVVSPHDMLRAPGLYAVNAQYYISKQVIPALERIISLVGGDLHAWFAEMRKPQSMKRALGAAGGWSGPGAGPGGSAGGVLHVKPHAAPSAGGASAAAAAAAPPIFQADDAQRQAGATSASAALRASPVRDAPYITIDKSPSASGATPAATGSGVGSRHHRAGGGSGAAHSSVLPTRTLDAYCLSKSCELCGAPSQQLLCATCAADKQRSGYALWERASAAEAREAALANVCRACTGIADPSPILGARACDSLDCPVFFQRIAARDKVQAIGAVLAEVGLLPPPPPPQPGPR